jgi:hypothetical protein
MSMGWYVAVLAFVCALELILIVALDRYAHGLARRIDQLEQVLRKPAPIPRVMSEASQSAFE